MFDPVMTPTGLSASRLGDVPDQAANARPMTAMLLPIGRLPCLDHSYPVPDGGKSHYAEIPEKECEAIELRPVGEADALRLV